MRTVLALVRAHWRMQRREPGYWIVTLGLAVTIVVVYGSLFADPASPQLGLVLEDSSPLLDESVRGLEAVSEIDLRLGSREAELEALREGKRWAVLVVPAGSMAAAGRGETARLEVVYSDRSPFEATTGRGVLREFVAGLNASLVAQGAEGGPLQLEERTTGSRKTLRLLDILFPGIVGMTLMWGNSWAAGTIVWWRQMGVLRRIGSSPVRPWQLEVSQVLAFAGLSALQVALLVGLGRLLFDVQMAGSYLDMAVVAGLGVLAFMGVWYTYAAVMPSTTSFFSFLNLTSFLMMFLGGSAFPLEEVPAWLQPLVRVLPLTYLNDALRGIFNRGEGLTAQGVELAVLGAWALLGFALSVRLFRWGRG